MICPYSQRRRASLRISNNVDRRRPHWMSRLLPKNRKLQLHFTRASPNLHNTRLENCRIWYKQYESMATLKEKQMVLVCYLLQYGLFFNCMQGQQGFMFSILFDFVKLMFLLNIRQSETKVIDMYKISYATRDSQTETEQSKRTSCWTHGFMTALCCQEYEVKCAQDVLTLMLIISCILFGIKIFAPTFTLFGSQDIYQ